MKPITVSIIPRNESNLQSKYPGLKIMLTCLCTFLGLYAMAQQPAYNKGNFYIADNGTMNIGGDLVNAGSGIFTNNGTLVLQQNFSTPGFYTSDSGLTKFTGTALQTITGSPQFCDLDLSNTSTGLLLNNTITVTRALSMNDGDLNLNGSNIQLGPAGTLYNETNDKRIYGNSGVITTTRTLNAPSNLNIGGMGVIITTPVNLGLTTIERGHAPQVNGTNYSIQRYFDITPLNNAALNARIKINYFDNELNGLTEGDFALWSSDDGGITWLESILDSADYTANYAVKEAVDAFYRVTIGNKTGETLPVTLLDFSAKCDLGNMQIVWSVASETNNSGFTLAKSSDGIQYYDFAYIPGAGNGAYREYFFTDNEYLLPQTVYYRLQQTDYNGTTKIFAPVSAESCYNTNAPSQNFVYPNPFTENIYLSINAAEEGPAMVGIFDRKGELVRSLQLECATGANLFSVNLQQLASGEYHLKITQGNTITNTSLIKMSDER